MQLTTSTTVAYYFLDRSQWGHHREDRSNRRTIQSPGPGSRDLGGDVTVARAFGRGPQEFPRKRQHTSVNRRVRIFFLCFASSFRPLAKLYQVTYHVHFFFLLGSRSLLRRRWRFSSAANCVGSHDACGWLYDGSYDSSCSPGSRKVAGSSS